MITPSALDNLQWQAYLIFMCLNLSFIPLVYFFYPETSNLTLEEIDHLFTSAKDLPPHGASALFKPTDPVRMSFEQRHAHIDSDGGHDIEKSSSGDKEDGAMHFENLQTEK